MQTFTCSESTKETTKKCVKQVTTGLDRRKIAKCFPS